MFLLVRARDQRRARAAGRLAFARYRGLLSTASLCLALLWTPALGRSQPAPPPTVVFVGPKAEAAETRGAMTAIRGHLAGTKVRARLELAGRWPVQLADQVKLMRTVARRTGARAVYWLVGTLSMRLYTFVPGTGSGRVFVRRISAQSQTERLEALALIVRASVLAVLAGTPAGTLVPRERLIPRRRAPATPRPPARRGPTKPRPLPKRPPQAKRGQPTLQVAYMLDVFASEPDVLHGAWLALSVRMHRYLSVHLAYRAYPPIRRMDSLVSLRLQRHPLTLGLLFEWPLGRVAVGVLAAAGLEVTTYQMEALESAPETTNVAAGGEDFVAIGQLLVLGSVRLVWRLRAMVGLGIQVPMNRRRYFTRAGTETDLVAPLAVQPLILIGLSVAAW